MSRPTKIHTPEQVENFRLLCASNLFLREIAKKLNLDVQTVTQTIKRLGITHRDGRLKNESRKYVYVKHSVCYRDYLKNGGYTELKHGPGGLYAKKMVK